VSADEKGIEFARDLTCIDNFKDVDRRTMRIVQTAEGLRKQAV
jgi:hypothetical protein